MLRGDAPRLARSFELSFPVSLTMSASHAASSLGLGALVSPTGVTEVQVRWFYRPEETMCGRRPYHGEVCYHWRRERGDASG